MARDSALILAAGGMLLVGVLASVLAARLRAPAMVLFLLAGMVLGSDGVGLIDFADYDRARLIGTCALVLILFEGGLSAGWHSIRPVLGPAVRLAVAGTVITALIAAVVAKALFALSLAEALLLGAILSPTDGAAVFSLMRGTSLPRRVRHALEGEAGFNDPVAVLLVLMTIDVIVTPRYGAGDAVLFFVRELGLGLIIGALVAVVARAALRRLGAAPGSFILVASLATAAVAYGGAGVIGGSGFLAVYIAGLAIGDVEFAEQGTVRAFHEGLSSVAEVGMFLALGLLVFPSQLPGVAGKGLALAVIVAVIARPLAVALSTVGLGLARSERVLLGWAGLRGAIPVVLATLPVIRHVPHSQEFFNIVFFAVLVSATVQGLTVGPLATALKRS